VNTRVIAKRQLLGHRIKSLREEIGLSQHDLASATGLSSGTIANIEGDKANSGFSQILTILYFFGYEIEEIAGKEFVCPNEGVLRNRIQEFHKNSESASVLVYLEKQPSINYAIKKRILASTLLDTPQRIQTIKEYLKKEYSWTYKSSSITNTLSALASEGLISIENHAKNKNWKIYRRA